MGELELSPEDRNAINVVLRALSERANRSLSLDQLLTTWCSFVEKVEGGYSDSIYEYTNDLASRDVLEELLEQAPGTAKARLVTFIEPWDERFARGTRAITLPIAPGVSKSAPSRWFRVPRILGGELEADLHSQGIY